MMQFLTGILRFFMGWLATYVGTIMATLIPLALYQICILWPERVINYPVSSSIIASIGFLVGGFIIYRMSDRYVAGNKSRESLLVRGCIVIGGSYIVLVGCSVGVAVFGLDGMRWVRTQGGETFNLESYVLSFTYGLEQSGGVINISSLILYWIAGRIYSRRQASTPSAD
tara:strand:+ start:158 stop:667 length:510 start_codon:yes stop_codon:yes gene_type:complete